MTRFRLVVAYEGTRYAGWQVQAFKNRVRPPTVQAEIEKIFVGIVGHSVSVQASGRTDAGVHADGQVCHVDIPADKAHVDWLRVLNDRLPADIVVRSIERAHPDFHARRDALRKTYTYTLWMHATKPLPQVQAFCWGTPMLNQEWMREAAAVLVGTHDFAVFQNAGTPLRSTVRTIERIEQSYGRVGQLVCPPEWPLVAWHITGDGFLKQMVRNIIGLLVWVGLGKISPATVESLVATCERSSLPSPSAPACGLSLSCVEYPAETGAIQR